MSNISQTWLSTFFILTTLLCLFFVYKILKSSIYTRQHTTKICLIMLVWLIIQAFLTLKGVYSTDTNFLPPKILLFGVLPTILFQIILFSIPNFRKVISSFSLDSLALLSIVRIPVEIALLLLFLNKLVPQSMTFEGQNFDIISGLTTPIIVYLFHKYKNPKVFLAWHFLCLALLVNIVYLGIFSATTPLQRLGFEQPNLAIVQFPYCWLPTFIVPWVLFSHLASIKILLSGKAN